MTSPTHGGRVVEAEPTGEAHATAPLPHHHRLRGALRRAVLTSRPAARTAVRLLAVVTALLAATVLGLAISGCGGEPSEAGEKDSGPVTVFASSVLTSAFTDLGETYAAGHPGVEVIFNFAGAGDLVAQMQQGAPADVLAVADASFMAEVSEVVDTPRTFARNHLAIAVAPGNPLGIMGLSDLARPDIKVILGSEETSVGRQSQEALSLGGVVVEPASFEVTVKGVVTKVALGEADAGIVFVTDVLASDGDIDGVTIPDEQNVVATYPIASVVASERGEDAQAFIDLVLSAEGQKVLAGYGFLPAP